MVFFDPVYLLLVVLPTAIISGLAQLFVRGAYARWGQVRNGSGVNGRQAAALIMRNENLRAGLEETPQPLGDHFDPGENVVRLSPDVAYQPSIAAMAIAAHEFGHVQQHQQGSALMQARNFLVPAVQISPMISYGLIFAGLIFNMGGLAWLGVLFFGVTVLFMLMTLPIEIDASMRAMRMMDASGLLVTAEDRTGARQMLTAAALTYVAAAVTAIIQLVYYISLVSQSNRD